MLTIFVFKEFRGFIQLYSLLIWCLDFSFPDKIHQFQSGSFHNSCKINLGITPPVKKGHQKYEITESKVKFMININMNMACDSIKERY